MKKNALLFLLTIAFQSSFSQLPTIKFDHFTVRDGLPERQVQFIKQDSRGYIWIGTQNGLVKYDGYKPKVYRFGVNDKSISSNCSVRAMLEDNDKKLWFSTLGNGIFSYDPATGKFNQYKYLQKPGETALLVMEFQCSDKNNNLWGYMYSFPFNAGRLVKFNTQTGNFEYYDKARTGAHFLTDVTAIVKMAGGGIIIATNNGLAAYNYNTRAFDREMVPADTSARLKVDLVYEAPSEPGVLWMNLLDMRLKKYYIRRFNTRTKAIKDYHPSANDRLTKRNDTVNTIIEDKEKRLWFATQQGLMLLNRKAGSFTNYMPADTGKEFFKNSISSITKGKNGTLWLASGKGILNFDPETLEFKRYTANPDNPYSVSGGDGGVSDMILDRSGLLWVAFVNLEIDRENGMTSLFSTWSNRPSITDSYPGNRTTSMVIDKDGFIYFTNKAGIYKWMPGSDVFKQVYKRRPQDKYLSGIDLDNDGNMYFASGNGLSVLDKKSRQVHVYSNIPNDSTSLINNRINLVHADHTGLVWVGTTANGINSFNPATQKFTHYPFIINNGFKKSKGELDDRTVLAIYEDRAGTIWTGTNFGGLSRFDRTTGKFKSYLLNGETRVMCVAAIFEDKEGRLWVGSYLDGLFEFNIKTGRYVRHLNEDNGLLFNSVDGILQDEKGFIWATTSRGFCRLNPADGSIKGFPLNVVMPGASAAISLDCFKSVGNRFVLGQANSIAMFKPTDLAGNPVPPDVHIESISHKNPGAEKENAQTVLTYGLNKLVVPWNQNRITINYVALHFADPAQNKYAYFLEGFDKQWVQAGSQREVTYTNLSPGTYTFRVKAANSDGVWNSKGDSFIIIIRSPWWFTWWAWLLYIVAFTASIYAFITYRSRYLVMENQQLEDKVALRTKQLSEQQEEITTQRDQLAETITDLKATQNQLIQSEKMASLGELTAGIAHEIQNPLNFVNNFSEVSMELVDEMELELSNGDKDEAIAIATDIKQNLEKIRHHGLRADGIVKGMLQHSRAGSGAKEPTNINNLASEFMRLAYHGLRAKDKTFNAEMVMQLDPDLPLLNVVPQDIGRVLLNLFNNAFYAVQQRQKTAGADYKPQVEVSTSLFTPPSGSQGIYLRVKDNGTGIPDDIKEKIMQPFFTTKPTGQGTGLGLSLAYDIMVKGHGGKIIVDSVEREYTEFAVWLPLK